MAGQEKQRRTRKPAAQTVSETPAARIPAPDAQAAIQACETAKASENKLPDKLSDLIRLAVKDAQTVAKLPGYKLDMRMWHQPKDDDTCNVCLAGSVMANTLGADRRESLGLYNTRPGNIHRWGNGKGKFYGSESDGNKLLALNAVRTGDFNWAATHMGVRHGLTQGQWDEMARASALIVGRYRDDLDGGRAPWDAYLEAADALEKVGL
jgi:hypothetical protein